MSIRCPRCGKINYGDVQKCSFCGSALKLIPGEEEEEVTQEDVQEKLSKMKAERIRNPFLIAGGGALIVVGIVVALLMYVIFMFVLFNSDGIESKYGDGALDYQVPGGSEIIYGEITLVVEYSDSYWETGNHGYENHTAYEIDGNGKDTRRAYYREEDQNQWERDLWVYSERDLGKKHDNVLIVVEQKTNDETGEFRAVHAGNPVWGGNGWIFVILGVMMVIAGLALLIVGLVGKADRSVERLLEEDAEFRRQQLNLIHAAKAKAQEEARRSGWGQPYPVQPAEGEQPQQYPQQPVPMGGPQQGPQPQPYPQQTGPLAQYPQEPPPVGGTQQAPGQQYQQQPGTPGQLPMSSEMMPQQQQQYPAQQQFQGQYQSAPLGDRPPQQTGQPVVSQQQGSIQPQAPPSGGNPPGQQWPEQPGQ